MNIVKDLIFLIDNYRIVGYNKYCIVICELFHRFVVRQIGSFAENLDTQYEDGRMVA